MSDADTLARQRKRSKAGCLTCRERRKKCDETHSNEHDGACQRCIQGAWKCQWPIPPTQQPVRVFERGARTKAREGRSTSRSASVDTVAPPLPEAAVPNSTTAVPAFTATPAALAPKQAGPAVTQIDGLAPSSSQICPPASQPSSPQRSSFAHLDSIRPGFHSLGSLGRIAEHANLEVTFQAVDQELYAFFYDAYFCSLSGPLRKIAVQAIKQTVTSTEVGRNAAMATCMLYRLHVLQNTPSSLVDINGMKHEEDELRARADEYFQVALDQLSRQPIPLAVKLQALMDLYSHQFVRVGAQAAQFLLLLYEIFIQELGPDPILDLQTIQDPNQLLLTVFGWEDVMICLILRRRPSFRILGLPGEPRFAGSTELIDEVNSYVSVIPQLGVIPVGLMLCVAAAANLAAPQSSLPSEVVACKAEAIEKAIRSWRPPLATSDQLADSATYLEYLASTEMYRHAILIYLYQTVWKHGPLSAIIAASLQQILRIGARYVSGTVRRDPDFTALHDPTSGGPSTANSPGVTAPVQIPDALMHAMRAVPFFLAGTAAIMPADRRLCLQGLRAAGSEPGWSDNIKALERIWEVQQADGWLRDWRDVLEQEDMHIAFL
ncbi:Zn(II)2Cys6 transcription factor [Rhodotorula paludigena]|uniref:Zn(II)2Cys6 transcription factor n=1 Tax=Rhodotorula paludigena TaxID=86838 RepID=UPI00317F6868